MLHVNTHVKKEHQRCIIHCAPCVCACEKGVYTVCIKLCYNKHNVRLININTCIVWSSPRLTPILFITFWIQYPTHHWFGLEISILAFEKVANTDTRPTSGNSLTNTTQLPEEYGVKPCTIKVLLFAMKVSSTLQMLSSSRIQPQLFMNQL